MQMPSRSQFADPVVFMAAMSEWMAASEASYQHLLGLFDATPQFIVKPDWIEAAPIIKHVAMSEAPTGDDVQAALRNLSGSAMNGGCKIVRVCHGSFEERGARVWACFAELQKA